MAQTVSFHEVVCKGSPKAVRGLLTGLAIGAGQDARFWFHHDADIRDPAAPRTMRRKVERLRLLPTSEVRVVVSGDLAKLLRSRRKVVAECGVCEVESIARIKQAQLAVRYHTYAKRYDDEVQALLGDLPRGVKLMNPTREVQEDPEARGQEAYAPAHDFESRGGGILLGRFDLVLELRDRLDAHPLVECEEIELITA